MREIYSNPEFRNQVAYAHGVYKHSTDTEPMQRITCSYPVTYIVTLEQITEASKELERAKGETISNNRGKLVLIGMGSLQKENPELMNNHRVRGYFVNLEGKRCFVEFIKGRESHQHAECVMLYPDHAMIEGVGIGAERKNCGRYTEANALRFVNRFFGCDFKEIVIDNFDLSPDEIISDCRMQEVSA